MGALSEPVLAHQRGTYDRMRAPARLAESPRGVTLFRHPDVVAAASDPDTFPRRHPRIAWCPTRWTRPNTRRFARSSIHSLRGTRVYLNWTSANRDETVFEDPDGTGIHMCPGRPLATMELVVAVRTLLGATTRIELAAGEEPVRETYPLGGWRRVPVRLH